MTGKFPHRLVVRISDNTYNLLQEELDKRNSMNVEKLVRGIIDRYAEECKIRYVKEVMESLGMIPRIIMSRKQIEEMWSKK
jgi:hypothetical protein